MCLLLLTRVFNFRFYDSRSILSHEECAQLFVSLLSGLSCINFKLSDLAVELKTDPVAQIKSSDDNTKEIQVKKHKKRTNVIRLDQ